MNSAREDAAEVALRALGQVRETNPPQQQWPSPPPQQAPSQPPRQVPSQDPEEPDAEKKHPDLHNPMSEEEERELAEIDAAARS